MSTITLEEVRAVAALARLDLSESEAAAAALDISSILSNFSAIADIDTSAVTLVADSSTPKNTSRADEEKGQVLASTEDVKERIPRMKDGYIQVPGVFSSSSVS